MKLGEVFCRMPTEQALPPTRLLVQAAAAVCEDKKGQDTRILELDPVDAGLSDFFLVTSAANDRQAIAIADEIEQRLKRDFGVYPNSVEGRRHAEWILLDYVDFVVHVFLAERRAFYDIERLRKSARPLTPAEFDNELKAALAAKTRAVRGGKPAKSEAAADSLRPKKAAKKSSPSGAASAAKPKPAKAATQKAAAKRAGAKAVAKAKRKTA
jgi:ribosome-associated protein